MNDYRQTYKNVVGFASGFGGAILVGATANRVIATMPNPIMRVLAHVGSTGLGIVVGNAAKRGTDELIDAVNAIVEEVVNK